MDPAHDYIGTEQFMGFQLCEKLSTFEEPPTLPCS
jgi:hypothetical protein